MQSDPNRTALQAKREKQCGCGATFRPYRSTQRYCSPDCPARATTRNCELCGEEFTIWKWYGDRDKRGLFCSRECSTKSRSERRWAWCPVCGVRMDKRAGIGRQTCGARACVSEAIARGKRGARNPNFQGDESRSAIWFASAADACVLCGSSARLHLHHVVYRQHVRGHHGDHFDPRDSLTLCIRCHCLHHTPNGSKLPLRLLRDENYEFAFELMGAAAYDYLRRHYSGEDERLDAALENDLGHAA